MSLQQELHGMSVRVKACSSRDNWVATRVGSLVPRTQIFPPPATPIAKWQHIIVPRQLTRSAQIHTGGINMCYFSSLYCYDEYMWNHISCLSCSRAEELRPSLAQQACIEDLAEHQVDTILHGERCADLNIRNM